LGLAALVVAYAIDFHFDVRHRDVFSWMDPYQYYDFARGLLAGNEHIGSFEIPSIFPLMLIPALAIDASIPSALHTNLAFTALLAWAVFRLCREVGISSPAWLVVALVLSSPLLLGLSRTVYIEYGLSAVVALAFVFWLRFLRAPDFGSGLRFAITFAVGFLMKTTFPLFFVAPLGAAIASHLHERRSGVSMAFVYATLTPIALVVLIHATVFTGAAGYYERLGNTFIPIMKLVGPPESFSWDSAHYYFAEMGRTGTALLTPFLLLAAVLGIRRMSGMRMQSLGSPRTALWLWLLGPLVLLIAEPVKEPRHIAPCVVPAVLLIVIGIESCVRRSFRLPLLAAAGILAIAQFLWVTRGALETPYFLDHPLRWTEIRGAMVESAVSPVYRATPPAVRPLHWSFNQNVVLAGFSANEALAITWQLFPGVVFDLSTFADPERMSPAVPYAQFEDLFLLSAFNTYNRRSGWRHYYESIPREDAIRNADFVLVNDVDGIDPGSRFPDHTLVRSVPREIGSVHVLRSRLPTTPYRVIYAQRFLARSPMLTAEERRVVSADLLMAAVLGGYRDRAENLIRRDPDLQNAFGSVRNIYWIGGYGSLIDIARGFRPAP